MQHGGLLEASCPCLHVHFQSNRLRFHLPLHAPSALHAEPPLRARQPPIRVMTVLSSEFLKPVFSLRSPAASQTQECTSAALSARVDTELRFVSCTVKRYTEGQQRRGSGSSCAQCAHRGV